MLVVLVMCGVGRKGFAPALVWPRAMSISDGFFCSSSFGATIVANVVLGTFFERVVDPSRRLGGERGRRHRG